MTWGGGTVPNWDASGGPAIQGGGAGIAEILSAVAVRHGLVCGVSPARVPVRDRTAGCRRAACAQAVRTAGRKNPGISHVSGAAGCADRSCVSRGGRHLITAVGDEKPCLEACAAITRMHLCGHPVSICPNPSAPGGGVQRMQGGECSGPRSVALWHGHEKRRESAHTVRVEQ